jgi:hypothetical protein
MKVNEHVFFAPVKYIYIYLEDPKDTRRLKYYR